MKRNRKRNKKMAVVAVTTMRFGAMIFTLFLMTIMYTLSNSSYSHLVKQKCVKENELEKLKESYQRELNRWEMMKTPEKIETALLRHGLMMKVPSAAQVVKLTNKGMVFPNQYSVKRAKQGGEVTRRAQNTRRNPKVL